MEKAPKPKDFDFNSTVILCEVRLDLLIGEQEYNNVKGLKAVDKYGNEFILHWFNTAIRTYKDYKCNHIEVMNGDKRMGLKVKNEFVDLLFGLEFPYHFDPFPDKDTIDWLVATETTEFNNIQDILSEWDNNG